MAFNPSVPDVGGPNNYLGYSRGVDPDQSGSIIGKTIGGAITDVAQIGNFAVNAADQYIKKSLFDEATKDVNKVRDQFGVNDAALVAGADKTKPLPPEIVAAQKRLNNLQQGYESGAIKEYYYTGQLQNITKSLKSKYPGYEKEVDATIQQITGITPANTLVNQLQDEAARSASKANSEQNFQRQYVKENQDWIVRWMPNYFNLPDDQKPTFSDVQAGVAKLQATDSELTSQKLALEAKNATKAATASDQEDVARATVNSIGAGVMSGIGNSIAIEQGQLQKKISDAMAHPGESSPDETEAMLQMANKLKLDTQQQIDLELLNPRYNLLDGKTKEDIRASAMAPVASLLDAITNKDYGTAGATLRLVNATKTKAAQDLLTSNGTISKVAAAQELLGPMATGIILQADKSGKILNDITTALTADTNANIVLGSSAGIGSTIKKAQETKGLDPTFYKSTVNQAVDALKNPNVKPDIRGRFADFLFGKDGNEKFLQEFNKNEQPKIYGTLINADVAKTMRDLGTSNPAVWDNYRKWAYTNFSDQIRGFVGDISQIPPATRDLMIVTFNESTGQLEAQMNPDKVDEMQANDLNKGLAPGVTQAMVDQAARQYQNINSILASIKPVMELDNKDSGRTMGESVRMLFQAGGLPNVLPTEGDGESTGKENNNDLLHSQQGSLDAGTQGFLNFVSQTEAGSNYDIMAGETQAAHNLTSMTLSEVMDLQRNTPGRPAVGGPQFKLPTLNWLKKTMGLTGDEDFTPELQDRMAAVLMERRGLSAYKSGAITKDQFANNLAMEWASFPTSAGKSYYAGVSWNKALVDRGTLLGEIDKLIQ